MTTRILSGVIGFPLLAVLVAVGGAPLLCANMALAIIGMHEIYIALSKKNLHIHYLGYFFALVLYIVMEKIGGMGIMMLCSLFMISILIVLIFQHPYITIIDCAITFFGFFYVAFLLSFIYLVRSHYNGQFFVWLIFICAFGSDTFAYFSGLAFGRHKLAPVLSPKKTVEGSIGGVLGALVIAFIYGFAVSKLFYIEDVRIILFCTVSGAVGAVFSQFGDLAASAIKRFTEIKDFGKLIPGHGGVLDRFDSVLFTAPAVYLVMIIFYYVKDVPF